MRRTARKVVAAAKTVSRYGHRWRLELECGHVVFRSKAGDVPPSRVNACERCTATGMWSKIKAARPAPGKNLK